MHWLNIPTKVLHAPEYIGSEPPARATWLNLMLWCAEQENGGMIADALKWSCRRWQQTCGVTADEVSAAAPLLTFEGADLFVLFYPIAQQETILAKRRIAQVNGQLGGRPITKKPISEPTSVTDGKPISEPTSESGRERKGKEGNIAPDGAKEVRIKAPRERNPLLDALVSATGADPGQMTQNGWGAAATALRDIRQVRPDVTPQEIARRAGNYRLHMPNAMLTAPALAKHWATCDRPPLAHLPRPSSIPHKPF